MYRRRAKEDRSGGGLEERGEAIPSLSPHITSLFRPLTLLMYAAMAANKGYRDKHKSAKAAMLEPNTGGKVAKPKRARKFKRARKSKRSVKKVDRSNELDSSGDDDDDK